VISPDGKYLAYGDYTGMHLKLIQTGETVNIPQPEGPAPDRAAWYPSGWFPDSTRFIASGLEADRPVSAWVISVMGGPPRKLRDDAVVSAVSPGGTLIAYLTGYGFFFQFRREIWLMGAQGEEPRRFVSASEDDVFWYPVWSPDGQRIVYIRFHRKPDGCTIESRDLKGGQPTVLVSDPRICAAVGSESIWWLPDGRIIYTMAEELKLEVAGHDANLWEIRVDTRTGQPLSEPRRLTNWPGANSIACGTADGTRLAVMSGSMSADVYVGELEAGGRRLKNTRRLTLNENNDYPGRWMPDSKALLFVSDRNGTSDIFKQALDQADAQLVVTGPDYKQQPVLSPDGSWILYLSTATAQVGPTAPVRIMRVPTSGGAPQLVLEGQGIGQLACAQSPATLCAFGELTPDQKQVVISAFAPVNGRGEELTRINLRQPITFYGWDLSRDGSRLAFTQEDEREDRIHIIPVAGGEAHEVNVKGGNHIYGPIWAADGKGLVVGAHPTTGTMLLYVDLEGRAVVLWQQELGFGWSTQAVPSPDGRHLALQGYSVDSNVWLLENF
jgi:Tol biopolymer transport system component